MSDSLVGIWPSETLALKGKKMIPNEENKSSKEI